ncbi:gap junction beta-2 protein-like [Hemicordylus capensis]|uniref:gap junction beta-2 protein-like n=1 Tax=Hemicordylus capensis TaxID=884348 RepID=UPI002302E102|nr:gap junction beta-2 protein-like [Hemicordylus capensis]
MLEVNSLQSPWGRDSSCLASATCMDSTTYRPTSHQWLRNQIHEQRPTSVQVTRSHHSTLFGTAPPWHPFPIMESDALTVLLSGTSARAPRLCRAGLAVLMALRLGALALGAKTLWRDEVGDLLCNATLPSCLLACFDAAFPVSPFNLFLLQMASVLTHGLACALLFRPPDSQGKGAWCRGRLGGKPWELRLHWVTALARVLLEGTFLMVFHGLYSQFPQVLHCGPSASCPEAALCAIEKAKWKDAFNTFATGTSWVSITLCLIALHAAATDVLLTPRKLNWGVFP